MNDAALKYDTQEIILDEVLPHGIEAVWKTLTDGDLMARWIMPPEGFAPVVGNRFTFRTTPAGEWDGTIHCEVLEMIPGARFAYAWRGGHKDNVGYGSLLDTVVTWTLSKVPEGTRLQMVHSGFVAPKNDVAYANMSAGWHKVVERFATVAWEQD